MDARVGDARSLPFEDDSFDVVLLHLVLSVIPDSEAVVAETARVLDSDGRVSIYDKFVPRETDPSRLRRAVNRDHGPWQIRHPSPPAGAKDWSDGHEPAVQFADVCKDGPESRVWTEQPANKEKSEG